MATKIEMAIDFIAKQGAARTPEIGAAADIKEKNVASVLYPYVRGGVLVSCAVQQPGKRPCNEYRLGTSVTGKNWRDFKVGIFKEDAKPKAQPVRSLPIAGKPATPPAPVPAVQPQVTDNNSGSKHAGSSLPPPAGLAVVEKPRRAAASPAAGVGGHVPTKRAQNKPDELKFCYWSDGSFEIVDGDGDEFIRFTPADAKRLADFLLNCVISTEVNA